MIDFNAINTVLHDIKMIFTSTARTQQRMGFPYCQSKYSGLVS
jgi:hypothetical protein